MLTLNYVLVFFSSCLRSFLHPQKLLLTLFTIYKELMLTFFLRAEAQTELDLAEKELQRTKDSIAALEEIIKLAMIDEVNKEADAFLVERKAEDEKKRIEEEEMKKQEEEQKKQDETLSGTPSPFRPFLFDFEDHFYF